MPSHDIDHLRRELSDAAEPQWQIVRLLGQGPTGAVFLAIEPHLDRHVALKIVAPHLAAEPATVARVIRAAKVAARLEHPHVMSIYRIAQTKSGLPYIAMPYVDGLNLSDWAQDLGSFGIRKAGRILGQVASGLAYAHAHGIAHGSVKPTNILLDDRPEALVTDFCLTQALCTDETPEVPASSGCPTIANPIYWSPEQALGSPAGPKSDVYSLGVVAYELLTGQPPTTAGTMLAEPDTDLVDTQESVRDWQSVFTRELPPLLDRCLSDNPDHRPDALEFAEALQPTSEQP